MRNITTVKKLATRSPKVQTKERRTLVVTDIHGCYTEFMQLLKKADYNGATDKLILLGDYIDRGIGSYSVVKMIQSLQQKYGKDNVVALMGNHEDMVLEAYDYGMFKGWYNNGGRQTQLSYIDNDSRIFEDLEWFRNLPLYHKDENFYYVHAGFMPEVEIEDQNRQDMLWIREEFFEVLYDFGKTVVFGHTPTLLKGRSVTPLVYGRNISLDTGCVYRGRLSCLEIIKGEVQKIYQVSKK